MWGSRWIILMFGLNWRYKLLLISSPGPQKGGHFKNFKIFEICAFWHQICKSITDYPRESSFDADDVSDDVTVRLWTLPSIFMCRRLLHQEQGRKAYISWSKNNIVIKRLDYAYPYLNDISTFFNYKCGQDILASMQSPDCHFMLGIGVSGSISVRELV